MTKRGWAARRGSLVDDLREAYVRVFSRGWSPPMTREQKTRLREAARESILYPREFKGGGCNGCVAVVVAEGRNWADPYSYKGGIKDVGEVGVLMAQRGHVLRWDSLSPAVYAWWRATSRAEQTAAMVRASMGPGNVYGWNPRKR